MEVRGGLGDFNRRSFVAAAGYDIRVTARCMVEDLAADPTGQLEDIAKHPIIRGLCGKHDLDPSFVDSVGPAAGEETLGVLQFGDDHRGAVWHDKRNNAFWLCAYRWHRSGTPDDAFPYFERLLADDRIYPDDLDRIMLYRDRAERLIDAIPQDGGRLRMSALASPSREISGSIGPFPARVVVVEVDGLHELYVALKIVPFDVNQLDAVLLALCPSADVWQAWRPVVELPTGRVDVARGELAYSCLLD
ncbi:MAG TPA: hypothetical protein VE011_06135 [Candidatus Dormibacteraeota bacterium]|nr:hypothetical protein [Candidatus Dormibacteraeota bacterium]